MTITPGVFSLLIGLRVGGDPLPIDPRIHEREGALKYLLGKVLEVSGKGHITYSWLLEQYDHVRIESKVSMQQLVRAFLLYLLGQTLFCNKDNSMHIQFLAALVNLEAIAEFDKGTPAFATLYGHAFEVLAFHSAAITAFFSFGLLSIGCNFLLQPDMGTRLAIGPTGSSLAERNPADTVTCYGPIGLEASFGLFDGRPGAFDATPCATQLYVLPTKVQQVLADVVQEWLRAFQSVEALVRRQHGRILEAYIFQFSFIILHPRTNLNIHIIPCSLKRSGCQRCPQFKVPVSMKAKVRGLVTEVKGGGFVS
ncbi:hypothetical protein RHMOL_Rhmol04G0203800 [Rhododendron molle]|uniref:Uncharacterized protein n=1 Tax=Rhododendron molle TaxID=49168 RepID=A0ACC0P519_RHOML|nr:hypothetical protein RHMOL_Rhmol04G0203800 [Rhododendron molle]